MESRVFPYSGDFRRGGPLFLRAERKKRDGRMVPPRGEAGWKARNLGFLKCPVPCFFCSTAPEKGRLSGPDGNRDTGNAGSGFPVLGRTVYPVG